MILTFSCCPYYQLLCTSVTLCNSLYPQLSSCCPYYQLAPAHRLARGCRGGDMTPPPSLIITLPPLSNTLSLQPKIIQTRQKREVSTMVSVHALGSAKIALLLQ